MRTTVILGLLFLAWGIGMQGGHNGLRQVPNPGSRPFQAVLPPRAGAVAQPTGLREGSRGVRATTETRASRRRARISRLHGWRSAPRRSPEIQRMQAEAKPLGTSLGREDCALDRDSQTEHRLCTYSASTVRAWDTWDHGFLAYKTIDVGQSCKRDHTREHKS